MLMGVMLRTLSCSESFKVNTSDSRCSLSIPVPTAFKSLSSFGKYLESSSAAESTTPILILMITENQFYTGCKAYNSHNFTLLYSLHLPTYRCLSKFLSSYPHQSATMVQCLTGNQYYLPYLIDHSSLEVLIERLLFISIQFYNEDLDTFV